jgi:hypothetical protein
MAKLIRTWLLETIDDAPVYTDGRGNYSLKAGGVGVEFIEDQNPRDDKEILRKRISQRLGVECKWIKGPGWTEDQLYG